MSMMKVYLSPLAEKKLVMLLEYLETEWNERVKDNFLQKLIKSFERVALYPKSCTESFRFPNLYKCVITEQTSFYYRIISDEIEVITVIDNRQDSDAVAREIIKFLN